MGGNGMQGNISGMISIEYKCQTLGELRDALEQVKEWKLSDSTEIEPRYLTLWVPGRAVPSECGDHLVGDEHIDWLVYTHEHPEDEPAPLPESKSASLREWMGYSK